jgi:predicted ATPase
VSPEQQRQQTLHALLELLLRLAATQPLILVMEDLHWVDPSTLEWLNLLVDQGPTARILTLCTCRPDFHPPWTGRSHLTQMTLARLPQRQATELTHQVVQGKALPAEVVAQIVAKTDGVPLFVEELTKTVLESGLLLEQEEHYALTGPLPPLAIPVTLHDSLLARLDRLGAAKNLAQVGATLGREFPYALLQAVASRDEETIRRELQQLVEAELLYQRGLPPQATYVFKHALIQEAAYQSLLRRTRQRYHQHIAQVLEAQFFDIVETQPELLAHHYTEAGVAKQALLYWQRAGERAIQRSAHAEAIAHLSKGLDLLKLLPDTPERSRQELILQSTLGPVLIATRGYAAPDVAQTYARARDLGRRMGDTLQLFVALRGLQTFHAVRAELQTALALAEELLLLAQRQHDPTLLVFAHLSLGSTLFHSGALVQARVHLEQGMALNVPPLEHAPAFLYGHGAGVVCISWLALTLWLLGYPDQAQQRGHEALTRARQLAQPLGLAFALDWVAWLHQLRREPQTTQDQAEAAMALCTEQGFAQLLAFGRVLRGWVLAARQQGEDGITHIRQGLAAYQATGAAVGRPQQLALLAEAHGQVGQAEAGLAVLAEALTVVGHTGERNYEAELHRLTGQLLLARSGAHHTEAEACFRQALDMARRQQAKSLELRAAVSLSRLWQQQGKCTEAYDLLAPVYGWFTEGFDTADLQDARALLDALA